LLAYYAEYIKEPIAYFNIIASYKLTFFFSKTINNSYKYKLLIQPISKTTD